MERGHGAILLIFGAMLIYLSIFGITGLFSLELVGSWTDDFNDNVIDTSKWQIIQVTGTTVTETSQILRITTTSSAVAAGLVARGSSSFDEAVVSVKVVTCDKAEAILRISSAPDFVSEAYRMVIQTAGVATPLLFVQKDAGTVVELYKGNIAGPVGTLKITVSGTTISFYFNELKVYTGTFQLATKVLYPSIHAYFGMSNAKVEFDDFMLSVGGGTTPPQGKGNLQVIGYYNSQPVQFSAYYTIGSYTSPEIVVPSEGYTWTNLDPGSYTVYGKYQSATGLIQKSNTVTVVSGQTATAPLVFAGEAPTPPWDPLEWLRQIFNNPTVKNIMLLGGVAMCGVGLVVLILPKSKPKPAVPIPAPRY